MPEHNCGGWCSAKLRQAPLALARDGNANRAVAETTGIPYGTVSRLLSDARKKGCIPAVPKAREKKGPSKVRLNLVCAMCGQSFVAKRASTYYCSDKCRAAGYKAGARVIEKRKPHETGGDVPLVEVDEVGMRRRLASAAEEGVEKDGLMERFGEWLPEAAIDGAIATARANGRRTNVWPLGIPA